MHMLHALLDGRQLYIIIGRKEVDINHNEKGGKFLPEPLPELAVSLTLLLSVRIKKRT